MLTRRFLSPGHFASLSTVCVSFVVGCGHRSPCSHVQQTDRQTLWKTWCPLKSLKTCGGFCDPMPVEDRTDSALPSLRQKKKNRATQKPRVALTWSSPHIKPMKQNGTEAGGSSSFKVVSAGDGRHKKKLMADARRSLRYIRRGVWQMRNAATCKTSRSAVSTSSVSPKSHLMKHRGWWHFASACRIGCPSLSDEAVHFLEPWHRS